jgi:hypothetical protein
MREEIGLSGDGWVDLGERWHKLAALWLRAETLLGKSGQGDLTFKTIFDSNLPDPLKEWLSTRILRTDAARPGESFGKEFTTYLVNLPWGVFADGNGIMNELWCRPGKTGIIIFLVGLYWQAVYSGSGKTWASNLERVETIFRAILKAPALYVAIFLCFTIELIVVTRQREKRGRAESSGAAGEIAKRIKA